MYIMCVIYRIYRDTFIKLYVFIEFSIATYPIWFAPNIYPASPHLCGMTFWIQAPMTYLEEDKFANL